MDNEKRMAKNYEITQSIRVGEKEIVFGVDEDCEYPYLCAYYESNDLLGRYYDCLMSDDYTEIIGVYAQRIQEQGNRLKEERSSVTVPTAKIIADQCIPDSYEKNIEGKVIVIRPEVLRREYQTADRQLWLCTGGFGASANSRGSACYCINIYSGKETRWERRDVMGEMKGLPDWAKERLAVVQSERQKAAKEREER
ncbi:MAG TPA: hypothetical protein GX401_09800 [Clostridiales bacterium]|nr:hypothetical protein [Clostridiales bacterium]